MGTLHEDSHWSLLHDLCHVEHALTSAVLLLGAACKPAQGLLLCNHSKHISIQAHAASGSSGSGMNHQKRRPSVQAGALSELVLYSPAVLDNALGIPVQLQLLGSCIVSAEAKTSTPLPSLPASSGLSRVAVLFTRLGGSLLTSQHINLDDAGSQHILLQESGADPGPTRPVHACQSQPITGGLPAQQATGAMSAGG